MGAVDWGEKLAAKPDYLMEDTPQLFGQLERVAGTSEPQMIIQITELLALVVLAAIQGP